MPEATAAESATIVNTIGMIKRNGRIMIPRIHSGILVGLSAEMGLAPRRKGTQKELQKRSVRKSLCPNPWCHRVSTGGRLKPVDPTDP
jgi:hypothetical protein